MSGATQRLRTGRSSQFADQSGGGSNADFLIQKPFFDANFGIPSTTFKELLYNLDPFDFISGGGAVDYKAGRGLLGATEAYLTYDLVTECTKILLVTAPVGASSLNQGIYFCDTIDGGNVPQDGTMFMNEMNSSLSSLYKLPSFSAIWQTNLAYTKPSKELPRPQMAMYIDLDAHRIVTLYRFGAEQWWTLLDTTDAVNITLAQARYVGVYLHSGPAMVGVPFAAYGE